MEQQNIEKTDFSQKTRPRKGWRKEFYRGTTITDRSLEDYKELLDLSIKDLKDKLVLDIGSGMKEIFAKEAEKKGIKVISLNPDTDYWKAREQLKPLFKLNEPKESVAGETQDLPFVDEIFDVEVSLFGVPSYLPSSKSEYRHTLEEVVRTLKPGGNARFYPVYDSLCRNESFKDCLKELSSKIDFRFERVAKDLLDERDMYRLIIIKKSKDEQKKDKL